MSRSLVTFVTLSGHFRHVRQKRQSAKSYFFREPYLDSASSVALGVTLKDASPGEAKPLHSFALFGRLVLAFDDPFPKPFPNRFHPHNVTICDPLRDGSFQGGLVFKSYSGG